MDLFDEAVNSAPLTQRTATQQNELLAEWGLEATLSETPEPALPSTDGSEEEEVAQRVAAALRGAPAAPEPFYAPPVPQQHTAAIDVGPPETELQRGARLLAYADAAARGEDLGGPNPFAHLDGGQDDNEIAAAAREHVAKLALKSYSPAERQQIIEEGVDVTASNLDRLDIKGTHYEAMEARASVPEDEDLTFLDGDPNGSDF